MTPAAAPETLRLQTNEPEIIALTQALGKPCQSRFSGDQVMFTLVDGRKLYVDPYEQDRINALGVQPGTPFEIEKQERTQGNRRSVEVVARRMAGRPAAATTRAAAPVTQPFHATAPTALPPNLPAPAAPVSGAGETHAEIMARCYCAAVDIALATQACAEKKGLRITPQFEDIRTMGTALLISETGGRR